MTHKLQTIGSFDSTKLERWDFWSTDSNFGQLTSNLGSFNGIFQQSVNFGQQTAYHSSLTIVPGQTLEDHISLRKIGKLN